MSTHSSDKLMKSPDNPSNYIRITNLNINNQYNDSKNNLIIKIDFLNTKLKILNEILNNLLKYIINENILEICCNFNNNNNNISSLIITNNFIKDIEISIKDEINDLCEIRNIFQHCDNKIENIKLISNNTIITLNKLCKDEILLYNNKCKKQLRSSNNFSNFNNNNNIIYFYNNNKNLLDQLYNLSSINNDTNINNININGIFNKINIFTYEQNNYINDYANTILNITYNNNYNNECNTNNVINFDCLINKYLEMIKNYEITIHNNNEKSKVLTFITNNKNSIIDKMKNIYNDTMQQRMNIQNADSSNI